MPRMQPLAAHQQASLDVLTQGYVDGARAQAEQLLRVSRPVSSSSPPLTWTADGQKHWRWLFLAVTNGDMQYVLLSQFAATHRVESRRLSVNAETQDGLHIFESISCGGSNLATGTGNSETDNAAANINFSHFPAPWHMTIKAPSFRQHFGPMMDAVRGLAQGWHRFVNEVQATRTVPTLSTIEARLKVSSIVLLRLIRDIVVRTWWPAPVDACLNRLDDMSVRDYLAIKRIEESGGSQEPARSAIIQKHAQDTADVLSLHLNQHVAQFARHMQQQGQQQQAQTPAHPQPMIPVPRPQVASAGPSQVSVPVGPVAPARNLSGSYPVGAFRSPMQSAGRGGRGSPYSRPPSINSARPQSRGVMAPGVSGPSPPDMPQQYMRPPVLTSQPSTMPSQPVAATAPDDRPLTLADVEKWVDANSIFNVTAHAPENFTLAAALPEWHTTIHHAALMSPILKPDQAAGSNMFSWISTLLTQPPPILRKSQGSLQKHFQVPADLYSSLARSEEALDMSKFRLVKDGSHTLRLRSLRLPPQYATTPNTTITLTESQYYALDPGLEWHENLLAINLNKDPNSWLSDPGENYQALEWRRRTPHAKTMTIDMTDLVISGFNRLDIIVQRTSDKPEYIMCVEDVVYHDEATTRALISPGDAAATPTRIRKSLSALTSSDDDTDDELEIVTTHITVHVRDPLSGKLLENPVRSTDCRHNECFSLTFFLESRRLNAPELWRCPLCNVDARPHKLVADPWLENVVAKCDIDVDAIEVDAEGGWKAKEQKKDERSSKKAAANKDSPALKRELQNREIIELD